MHNGRRLVYEFGDFRLDPGLRILLRKGEPITVWPKVFDTLSLLLQSNGRIVEKEELMQALWPESFVEESNLTQNIFILRKILGDDRNGHSFIQTVPRRGYKFIAPVREADPASSVSDLPAAYWRGRSPFRGLQVFETEDAWLFFGREPETDELLEHLRRSAVLSVVGNSGSGKSSLLRAGLIPALQQGRFCPNGLAGQQWRIALFRPSGAPLDSLAEVLPGQLTPELSLQKRAEFIGEFRKRLPHDPGGLRDAIAAMAGVIAESAGPTRILLVADQFEEIFTFTSNREERDHYIDALLGAARLESAVPVHVVFAMRADFYPECMEHAALSRAMAANQYNVGRMSHEQLRESIEKRLHLASAQAEAGLIDSLLQDVGSEPGNLALLEHALGQMWERCGGFGCTLTNRAYAEIGRLRGALRRHADEIYSNLRDDAQKQLAKRIFLELVHVGDGAQDTRRRIAKADLLALAQPEEVETLLSHLASSRLISTGGEEQASYVEVSHEALIREWPSLREWIAQNREDLRLERRLQLTADEWNSLKRDRSALLQGARLVQAEEWLSRHLDAPVLLKDFVVASVAARKEAQEHELAREKAAAMRLRWFSASLAVLLLLAIATVAYIHHQRVLEKSRTMAAQSGVMLERDHGQALDLAIRSWETARTEEARIAVTRAFPEPLAILKHDGPVRTANFSPDGKRVVTASYDHTAAVWDAADGHLLFRLVGHTDGVEHAHFSPDGKQIVTASHDHTARVWSNVDGRLLFVLKGHSDRVWQARFSPDGKRIVTASFDKTAKVWSASDGRLLATLRGHSLLVGDAEFSSDGRYIVTPSWDHTARLWDSANGRLLMTMQHNREVIDAQFSPDDQTIATVTFHGMVKLWNRVDGKLLLTLQQQGPIGHLAYSKDRILTGNLGNAGASVWNSTDGRLLFRIQQDGPVKHVGFSPDGSYIATAGQDNVVRIWSNADSQLLATLGEHTDAIQDAEFSPDGRRFVTASDDGTARIWILNAARSDIVLPNRLGPVKTANFSRDGSRVVITSLDKAGRVWNSADGHLLATLQGHTDTMVSAVFSPDGHLIVTASYDRTARVWDSTTGRCLSVLRGHSELLSGAVFSGDGRSIVTTSYDHTARVWNAADGRLLVVLAGHKGQVAAAEFSPDDQHIVTAGLDHTARIWNAADGRLLFTLNGHKEGVTLARFSPDGQYVVTAGYEHTARIWSARDGHLVAELAGHSDSVWDARFSPDGQRILTASFDHTARLWNSADGRFMVLFRGHTGRIFTSDFSPDGLRVATASEDKTARIWNATDGSLIAVLHGHSGSVSYTKFSPDGQYVETGSDDTTARMWQVLTLDDVSKILGR